MLALSGLYRGPLFETYPHAIGRGTTSPLLPDFRQFQDVSLRLIQLSGDCHEHGLEAEGGALFGADEGPFTRLLFE